MDKYITTFEMKIRLKLDEGQASQANKLLNKHFIGHELFQAGDKASADHINACYTMQSAQYKIVTVGLKLDGELEIIK